MTQLTLRIMTYNIRHAEGSDGAISLRRIADTIREANVDIVALQEVDRFWQRSGFEDQPRALSGMLGLDAHYGPNVILEPEQVKGRPREYGVAIFSRFPVVHCENHPMPTSNGWESRGFLETCIAVPGFGNVAVINTHLQSNHRNDAPDAQRQRFNQASAIKDHVYRLDTPTVVVGDFNATPESEELQVLTGIDSPLLDVGSIAGIGAEPTFLGDAHNDSHSRIDYILATRRFTVASAAVLDNVFTRIASDHLPVTATLSLRGS